MAKILGLVLGINTIGWALIDDHLNKILGMGSHVFPMGVVRIGEGDNEISKNESRRGARKARRQFFRKRLRKKVLLKGLSENNMCPLSFVEIENWKKNKEFPLKSLVSWFALNPYELRYRALNEKISLHEIGRLFYHFIQRRGFLSNSRRGGKSEGVFFSGSIKERRIGINETQDKIQNKYLGSYLYEILPKENQPFYYRAEKIRNRYTTRKMYIDEFEMIWEMQKQFHPVLNDDLKEFFGGRKVDGAKKNGILFYQRALKSQKHLVGKCYFESTKAKCPISAIPFELFKVWQWVNTIEYNGKKLSQLEKERIVDFLCTNEKSDFKKIRKIISKESAEFKFNYNDGDKIVGTHTISNLCKEKYFGAKWFLFSDKEKEDIWHVLHFFDSKSNLKAYAIKNWNFTFEQAESISKFSLKDGYGSLSRKAINNILPFLQMGFTYDVAVVLGGIKNTFGLEWEKLTTDKRNFLLENVEGIVCSGIKGDFIEIIKEILRRDYNISDSQMRKLYHYSNPRDNKELLLKLPIGKEADKKIQGIRNPILITALFELRKLINELIDNYGSLDEIRFEMNQDLKISKLRRNKIRREQKRLERENERVKVRLAEEGIGITYDNLLRYKLWEESKKTCIYTGKIISLSELYSNKIQIEYIHPWSRSLNDSFANKILCYAEAKRNKEDKTPYEFYGNDETEWLKIRERALKLFSYTKEYPYAYQKFIKFEQRKFDDNLLYHYLKDTSHASREVKDYLSLICQNTNASSGKITSYLRQKWGLNTILNSEKDKLFLDDHRRHSIDALVVACNKISCKEELTRRNCFKGDVDLKKKTLPWKSFLFDAEATVKRILVSHKKKSNDITVRMHSTNKKGIVYNSKGLAARGQLHKETVFGKRNFNGEEAFHVRKPIDSLVKLKQIEKVVDESIRKLILKRIQELGGYVKGNIPRDTFFITDEKGVKQPQIFLPNKNGASVPILKVRMKEKMSGAKQLKENINQWVNPFNNHHVLIFRDNNGNLKGEAVTFWKVIERKVRRDSIYKLPIQGKEIITILHNNDMFLLGLKEDDINWENPNYEILNKHLYRVQKLSSKYYEFRINTQSSTQNNFHPFYVGIQGFGKGKTGWFAFSPIKVKISVLGKIKRN